MNYKKCFFLQIAFAISINAVELLPCPSTPNCVNSSAVDNSHHIESFPIYIDGKTSLDTLAHIIESMPRSKIIERSDIYLHAEFASKVFYFIDDVEFLINEDKKVIEVRSAARVGYGDFGVNRKRVEMLRVKYLEEIER